MSSGCKDIARQLIEDEPGASFKVIMGGGRRHFIPNTAFDPRANRRGRRLDGRDLLQEWLERKRQQGLKEEQFAYVNSTRGLRGLDLDKTEYLLGVFNYTNLAYEPERDRSLDGEPSLAEMTETAIKILQKNNEGFVLLVEGGRIGKVLFELRKMTFSINSLVSLYNILSLEK